jgi:3',5'-cyclic AMP phosphodiesterase CpdA
MSRKSIKDLPIYPVRGNHDCWFNSMTVELELSKKYPTWKMDNWWYEQQYEIGPNGEKMALLHVDSCFLICYIYLKGSKEEKASFLESLDEETRSVTYHKCDQSGHYEEPSRNQMAWIKKTLLKQSEDPKIIWKTSYDHHPMYNMHYDDYPAIIEDFLPLLRKHKYDIYFGGHEHMLNHALVPETSEIETLTEEKPWWNTLYN